MHLGRSCFVILNKHMRAADILLLIAADRKKFRNHMIEHMAFRTHMGTHDICAQRCPPFQRFALALARSQGRSHTAARTACRLDRWGGPFPPSPRCYDARQTSLAAEAVCASVENDKAAEPVPPNRVGGRDPAHQGEPASPPTDCMRLGRLDRRCWPSRATHPGHGPPRGPGPPSFVRNHGHLSSPALNPVDPPASGHRGVAETRATKPKLDRGDHALHP